MRVDRLASRTVAIFQRANSSLDHLLVFGMFGIRFGDVSLSLVWHFPNFRRSTELFISRLKFVKF